MSPGQTLGVGNYKLPPCLTSVESTPTPELLVARILAHTLWLLYMAMMQWIARVQTISRTGLSACWIISQCWPANVQYHPCIANLMYQTHFVHISTYNYGWIKQCQPHNGLDNNYYRPNWNLQNYSHQQWLWAAIITYENTHSERIAAL